ncbi:ribonuclease E/G [Bacillus sp. 1P06AnD]|uniref:ribonuclease E/G n=1 Tax=Bacillus sp. 1P06AnD TaxID=3132208 RepID=UPI0039A18CEC
MKTILIDSIGREKRIAVMSGNELLSFDVWNGVQSSLVGNIYAGRVEKIVPGMDAAFVHYGPYKNGFLHKDDIAKPGAKEGLPINKLVTEGEKILIQIVRDENEHKGARVTGHIEISTPALVYIAGEGYAAASKKMAPEKRTAWKRLADKYRQKDEGMLIRTEMEEKDEAYFVEQLADCRERYQRLLKKASLAKPPELIFEKNHMLDLLLAEMKAGDGECVVDEFEMFQQLKSLAPDSWEIIFHRKAENLFAAQNIENQIERLYKKIVWLENGRFIVIEEGEAMTTIDVNTGKFTGKRDKAQTIQSTNLLAVRESLRQVKLRNITGMILIDLINGGNQQEIIREVERIAKQDRTRIHIMGFTDLGILQLTRKVTSPSLRELTTEECPVCGGTGRVESSQSAAFRLERELYGHRYKGYGMIEVDLSADVNQWFSGENAIFKERLQQETGSELIFTPVDSKIPYFQIKRLS